MSSRINLLHHTEPLTQSTPHPDAASLPLLPCRQTGSGFLSDDVGNYALEARLTFSMDV